MAYRLSFAEDVSSTMRATAREQLEDAATLLDDTAADPVTAIHDARKDLKKTRSLLRLARPALGRKSYRAENEALRDAGLALSGARDADVLVETVDKLAARFVGQLPASDFAAVREALAREARDAGSAAATPDRAALAALLRDAAERIEKWPLGEAEWEDLLDGAGSAYARGVTAFALVREQPSTERLHAWRRRVKDLWYHQRLLEPVWPALMKTQAKQAHTLSELLGDDHDLAVLRDRLAQGITLPAGPAADVPALFALIDERRVELQREAVQLGRRVYAETPQAFGRRLSRYIRAAVRDQPAAGSAAACEPGLAAAMPEGTEIERKWLLDAPPPGLERHPSEPIRQGYLAITDEVEVRVRRRGSDAAVLTVKSIADRVRVEEEIEIGERRFDALWPLTEGRRVEKTRYRIPVADAADADDLTIELDVYAGPLEGLVTAEVEFPTEDAAAAFHPPPWLGRDVTTDPRYKNRALAVSGRPGA